MARFQTLRKSANAGEHPRDVVTMKAQACDTACSKKVRKPFAPKVAGGGQHGASHRLEAGRITTNMTWIDPGAL